MAWSKSNPVNFTIDGDTTSQAIEKHINEFTSVYAFLNRLRSADAQATAPTDPELNALWIDTSGAAYILKYYTGSVWANLLEIGSIDGLQSALDARILTSNIVDNLNSTSTTLPLSANQGRFLSINKADIAGDATVRFKASDAVALDEVVTKNQLNVTNTWTANDSRAKTALNAAGTAPIYASRTWVNFDGTTASIRISKNVSSITDNGSGNFTVNLAASLADSNYCVLVTSGNYNAATWAESSAASNRTTTSVHVFTADAAAGTSRDRADTNVVIFR